MIIGIGNDIVKINRFNNKLEHYINKILTKEEINICNSYCNKRKLEFLAGRFAAKEAIYKAINISDLLISNIEVLKDSNGKPTCIIEGYKIHISISHEEEYAIAYALVEKL